MLKRKITSNHFLIFYIAYIKYNKVMFDSWLSLLKIFSDIFF